MRSRFVLIGFIVISSLPFCVGCSSGRADVEGTVKSSEGGFPEVYSMTISFTPADRSSAAKDAFGEVLPDGKFSLQTGNEGPGAYPGEYNVTLKVIDSYPPQGGPKVYDVDPGTVTVSSDNNNFEFKMTEERPTGLDDES